MIMTIAFWLYALTTLATVLIGLLYATRKTIMPYHIEALQTPWTEIDPNFQRLLKALLNGGGYYGIANGLFMAALLLGPFRAGEVWAGYAIGLIGLVGALPLGYIVYTIKKHTKGNPPLGVMIIVNGLMVAGLVATVLGAGPNAL